MHEFIYKQAKENALSSSMGCFMKGTLVETEEGWTPIDELKVGDLVMSRPENGIGEAVPKRVVNTFRYEDKEVVMLKFSQFPERNGGGATLVATPNHPFCVYGVVTNLILEHPKFGKLGAYWKGCDYDDGEYVFAGDEGRARLEALWAFEKTPYEMRLYEQPVWKRADQLERGDVVLGCRKYYVVEDYRPLYAYRDTDQAWAQPTNLAYGWKESDLGNSYEMVLTDESLNSPTLDWADVPNDENLLYVDEDGQRHYRRYRTTVYNIEVEDYHTYCVDTGGILVHNQNCGAERRSRVDSLEIRGKKELSDFIGRNPEAHKGKVYLTDDIKLDVSSRDGVDYFSGLNRKEVGWEGYNPNRDSFKTTQLKGWGSLSHRVGNEIHLLAYSLPYRNPFKTAGSQDLNSIALGDVMVYPDLAAHPAARGPAPLTNTFGDIKKGPFGSPTRSVLKYAQAMKDFDNQIARIRSQMEAGTLPPKVGQEEIKRIMNNRSQYTNELPATEKKRLLSAVHMLIRTSAALDFHDGAFKHMIIIQGGSKKGETAREVAEFIRFAADDGELLQRVNNEYHGSVSKGWLSKHLFVAEFVEMPINGQTRLAVTEDSPIYGFAEGGKSVGGGISRFNKSQIVKAIDGADAARQQQYKQLQEMMSRFDQNADFKRQETARLPAGLSDGRTIGTDDLAAILPAAKQYWLAQGADEQVLDGIRFTVSNDVPGHLAAYTQGNDVTLSADGAGYGWFVDTTPDRHEEFAARADGYSFTAAGMKAARRLDLLTVLIHEIGHVLNVGHSQSNDVMSNMLPPGERRLPNAQDALHLQYLAGIRHYTPPTVPLTRVWQPETVNSVLTNSNFAQGLHGWRQTGAVQADNGGVWLHEASDGHTRLAQAFRLNAKQKVLGFTLHDGHISDNGGTQASDAFEAALLDAATGKPLFTGGLDRSDSLLNMQADGSETFAPSIRRIYNADGSRSYHLDLSAYLAAQTAAGREADVWLGFDLLGFGNADSKIRISNIGLSEDMPVQHQKVNDPAEPRPSENIGGSTTAPKPSDNANGGNGTAPRPSENTNSHTGQPSLPDTPQPETRDEGPTETPATAFDVSDGLRIARDILVLLNPDDAAGTGGTWLWEQPVSVGEGKNYTLGFDYQARIDEPVLLKIYQGSRLIRQSRIDGGISGRFDLPLAGSGHTDFIRIYAERAAVSAAHAIMPSENPAARLSAGQRLGWFLLAAALLLAMIAQYQGYPLLPARRRRQVILSGLPAGSTLGDGRHSFTATDERQEADIGDWDAGSLRLDLGGTPAADTRLLLTVTTPRFGISREIRRYAFVLDGQGGCEIWHNGALLAASGKRTAETSDGQIRLDLSAIVKNRLQNDETWMRRAEKRLAQSWQLFKKQ